MKNSLNHAYRLIWDDLRGAYIAVAEITRGRGKRASAAVLATALITAPLLAAASAASPPVTALLGIARPGMALQGMAGPGSPAPATGLAAGALPTGGQIAAGQATIGQQGPQMTVQQNSQRLILNWNSFDIGAQAGVRFDQPNRDAVALNRVLGNTSSQVLGELTANGQVWLVNPNGVVFGKGAQVNVGGLVASSLSISDSDFLAGRARFSAATTAAGTPGAVRNEGQIRAEGGVVALLGPVLHNSGQIQADQVGLGAGSAVTLDFGHDGLLQLQVDPSAVDAEIRHSGLIQGRNVVLSARSASALRASVINLDGVVEASSLSERGGRIVLDGGESGEVRVTGTLDASAKAAQGGQVSVTGQHVVLEGGATLDASGATGGGSVHVGGGWQGSDASIRNATTVSADASVTARANATDKGHGGEVVFWSDGQTGFAGQIQARGGEAGGDGGRLEVSGIQQLHYTGRADARALLGKTGDLLLDPATLEVRGGGSGTGAINGSVVYEKDLEAQLANIILEATTHITFKDLRATGSTDGILDLANGVSFTVVAGRGGQRGADPYDKVGEIRFEQKDDTIRVNGSAGILLIASNWSARSADPVNGGFATVINVPHLVATGAGSNPAGALPTYDLTTATPGAVQSGTITVFGANGITIGGSVTTQGGYVRLWADADSGTGGGFTLNAPIASNGGNVYLASGNGGITMNGAINVGTGRLFFDQETGTYPAAGRPNGPKTLAGQIHATGDIDVNTDFTMRGGASIFTDGTIRFGTVNVNMDTGTGVLTLRANQVDWGTATLQNLSTASLRLEPADPATNMVLGDASGFASAATLAKLPGIKNLTIGREDGTGTISVANNFSFNATGRMELVNHQVDISAGTLTNTGGDITITADDIDISQSVTAKAGAGKVTLRQLTAANELHLGGGLSSASIGQVNAATLEIGRADGGNLVFDNDISTTASTVHLKSGQRVIGNTGGVAATRLAVTAGAGADLSDATFNFDTLALSVGGDTTVRSSQASWSLGSVDGVVGLSVLAGRHADITLAATQTLGLNAPIAFNGTDSTLRLQAGTGFQAGSATLSGQSLATVEFELSGAGQSLALGGTSTQLSGTALSRFNHVNTLRIAAGDDDVVANAFDLTVGNKVEVVARHLTLAGDLQVRQGGLSLDVAQNGLVLGHGLRAGTVVALNERSGTGIKGPGVIVAPKLALRGPGLVALDSPQQVQEIAADVGGVDLRNQGTLTVGTADGLSGVAVTGTAKLVAEGAAADLVLNQAVHAGNSAGAQTAALLAAGRNFINNAGASAVSVGSGRWLVYSTSPLADTRGGLAPQFKQYDASLSSNVAGSGNGFLYTVAPQVNVALTGTISKVYDGDASASVDSSQLLASGAIDGDQVVLQSGTAHYDDKNVGTGKTVTVDGVTVASASNGGVAVHGYQMAGGSTSASGAIGSITPRQIRLADGAVQDKAYDGGTSATLGALNLAGVVSGDVVSASGSASAHFLDKNAGDAKPVAVTGLSLSGADAANYQLSGDAQASIQRRSLNAQLSVADKVYDGSTVAQLTRQDLDMVIPGDRVQLDASAAFGDKNAGTGKAVTVTGSLSGADAGNYTLAPASLGGSASITPKTVDATQLAAASKTYDGLRDASVTGTVNGTVAGDQLGLDLRGQFADKNAGTGKVVDVQLALTGADAGNYQLATSTAQAHGDITPKTVDATQLAAASKTYDGQRDASVTGTVNGTLAGDQLGLDLRGQFADKNAGTGKVVDVQLALTGADAANYQLSKTRDQASGDITPKTVDATQLAAASKVYDGQRDASVTGTVNGAVAGDQLGLDLRGQFADKNAGTGKVVDVQLALTGADAANYQLSKTVEQASADVTPKTVDATQLAAASKTYDGQRDASVTGTVNGAVAGDQLGLDLRGQFADKNAGTGKVVEVQLALTGADAGNYQLAKTLDQASADIAPKTVDATQLAAASKVYDGQRDASVTGTVNGTVAGDQLGLDLRGQFADKNAGTGKVVDVQLALTGADAANYQLSKTRDQASGDITPKTVDATQLAAASKTYDGQRDASVTGTVNGAVAGDQLGLDLRGQFADKNAGTGKVVEVQLTLTGADAGNYQLATSTAQAHGDITPRTVTVGDPRARAGADALTVASKVYDGRRDASVTGTVTGTVAGDQVALDLSGQFADKNAGAGKVVEVQLALSGADAANYRLDRHSAQARGDITPRPLSLDPVTVADKAFDGRRDATLVLPALRGHVPGDDLQLQGEGQFDDGHVGRDKTVNVELRLTGADAGNYELPGNGHHQVSGSVAARPALTGVDALLPRPGAGNGTHAGTAVPGREGRAHAGPLPGVHGAASPAIPDQVPPLAAPAPAPDPALEQALRHGRGLSLAAGGEPHPQPRVSVLPVVDPQGEPLGRFHVVDLGDSISVHGVAVGGAEAVDLAQAIRARAQVPLLVEGGDAAVMQLEWMADGLLHAKLPRRAAQQGQDWLSLLGLSVIKRQAGVSPQQVRALVLRFQD